MRALRLVEERRLELASLPEPPPPEGDQVVVRMQALALNHIDVWGHRGMAFAKRRLPLTVGVEGAGTIAAVGAGVSGLAPGRRAKASAASWAFTSTGWPRSWSPCRPGW